MTTAYEIARKAKTGSTIKCPSCGKSVVKTSYHKVFCSNQKTHRGRSSCKDKYWNTVNPRGVVGEAMAIVREFEPMREGERDTFSAHPFDMDDGYYDENGE